MPVAGVILNVTFEPNRVKVILGVFDDAVEEIVGLAQRRTHGKPWGVNLLDLAVIAREIPVAFKRTKEEVNIEEDREIEIVTGQTGSD